jgi:hypothetical protein
LVGQRDSSQDSGGDTHQRARRRHCLVVNSKLFSQDSVGVPEFVFFYVEGRFEPCSDNFFRALRLNWVRSQVSSSSMALLSAIGFVLSVQQSGFLQLSGGSFVQCGRTVFAVAAAVRSFVRSSTAFRLAIGSVLILTLSKEVVGGLL